MYRGTVFMVICVLRFVIRIGEFHGLSAFEVKMVIEKLKRNKSPGINQIPAKLIKAEGRIFLSESLNLLNLFGIWRNILVIGRSLSL
jgi:hypothetical protein